MINVLFQPVAYFFVLKQVSFPQGTPATSIITLDQNRSDIIMFTRTAFLAAITALGATAQSYKASFTEYGSGDSFGSGNCNTATTACGK